MDYKKHIVGLFLISFVILFGCKIDTTSKNQELVLIEKGKSIASTTFLALSSELQKAMTEGGISQAVGYCSLRALPITDSLAKKYEVDIRRVSDKNRNPDNSANEDELIIIKSYKENLLAGRQLKPQVKKSNNGPIFYAPIITQDLCLNCHGRKSKIESYNIIEELYPEDLATGYNSGELRGIWSINL